MIASLPMYDRAETAGANDRLWTAIRNNLGFGPLELRREPNDLSEWTAPDLLLSQTCGLPFRMGLHEKVTLVATPAHELDCEDGCYYSVLVAHRDSDMTALSDFADRPVAINEPGSQSGWGALWKMATDDGITFSDVTATGSHRASAEAVSNGSADLAAIDAVTWSMIRRWDGFARNLRAFAETPPTPALPFITAKGNDPAPIRRALTDAIASLDDDDRQCLCLTGVTAVPAEEYMRLPIPLRPCQKG